MKHLPLLIASILFTCTLTACSGEEERRGTPHETTTGTNNAAGEGDEIRPGIDGSEATGQGPNDTISRGDDGATSY